MRAKPSIHRLSSVVLAFASSIAFLPTLAPADLSAVADGRTAESHEVTTAPLAKGPLEVAEDGNAQPFTPPSESHGVVAPNDKQIKSPVMDRHLPRPPARIQRSARFARAVWRMLNKKLKPRGAIGGEELALEGFEYRYRTSRDGAWSDWQVSESAHSKWIGAPSSKSEVAFQVRSVWRSQTGELFVPQRLTLKDEDVARSAPSGEPAGCTSQPGRHPGVAYATGGERTYAKITTNLCLGSLLLEAEDLKLKLPGPDPTLARTYNSSLAYAGGMLGFGWSSSLERTLAELPNGDVLYEDGQGASFIFHQAGTSYERPAGLYLTLEKLPDGRFTLTDRQNVVETYNLSGRLVQIADPDQNTTTLTWSGDRAAKVTDRAGRDTNLSYGADGLLSQISDPAGQTVNFAYSQGNLASVSYPGDADTPRRVTLYAYDSGHRLTRTGTPELQSRGETVSDTDCGDKQGEATILYDALGRVKSITNERHIIDDANQVELCGRPIGTSTTYAYEFGEQTCPDPVCVTDPREHMESYILDSKGRTSQVIDAEGRPTYLAYDSDSNLTQITEFRGSRQLKTILAYDLHGNLTSLKEPGHQNPTTFGYDERNNLVWKRTPEGQPPSSTHKPGDPLVARPQGQEQVAAAGDRSEPPAEGEIVGEEPGPWQYTYTSTGHLQMLTTPGGATWQFEYDAAGNRTATTDPEGHRTTDAFDSVGQLVSHTIAGDTSPSFAYEYGPACSESPYYFFHSNARRIEPDARQKAYLATYSEAGQLVAGTVVDNLGSSGCVFDGSGPSAWGNLSYSARYNADGLTIEECTSQVSGWADAHDILLDREANGSPILRNTQIRWTFFLCPAPGMLSAQARAHDLPNQVDQPDDTWTEDASGIQYGERYRTTFYAADGSIKDVKANEDLTLIQHHTHDAQDNDVRVDHDLERVTQTSAFDDANRETSRKIERLGEPSPWLDEQYAYDEDDNLSSSAEDGHGTTFEYDGDGQLTGSVSDAGRTEITYDASGNRLVEELASGERRTYHYDANGRLVRVECGTETCIEVSYNEFGQPSRVTDLLASRPGAYDYQWDFLGRLWSVRTPDGSQIEYGYDARTHVIDEKMFRPTESATFYEYDSGDRLVEELKAGGCGDCVEVAAIYNYDGQGNLISTSQPNDGQFKTSWYDFDALGNVVGLNDEFELRNSYRYDAWGNLTSSTGSVHNPFRYEGAFWDEDLQMYYIGDRWYNPRIGRFISPPVMSDPKEDAESVYDVSNPYVFANNNPLKYRNPSGWPPQTQIRRLGLDYFRSPNRFRKERVPQYWELRRRIELGSPSRAEGLR